MRSERLLAYVELVRWNRPEGWLLLLWPTLSALWIAAGGFPGWHLLTVFVLGTILMRCAGCCINDVADREFDRHVARTLHRPVTSGRLTPLQALSAGAVLALAAFVLVLGTNTATVAWSIPALALAAGYPYVKRFFAVPQAVLGVAFSLGIPMAFAAVRAEVPPSAWLLVFANLLWVVAYDTEYAMVDRDDDLRIGIRTSAIAFGRADVAVVLACYAAALGLNLLARATHIPFAVNFLCVTVAAAQAAWHYALIRDRSRAGCLKAFRMNHWLGFTLFAGTVVGYSF